jgi:hypothetical protein
MIVDRYLVVGTVAIHDPKAHIASCVMRNCARIADWLFRYRGPKNEVRGPQ